jgi:uncharacterized protein with PQ loop repeat
MQEKYINYIGWFASAMAIIMYVSYIDQVKMNLNGDKGSILQPLAATINCIAWTLYGFLKNKKDWPIIICNVPGIFLGGVTFYTAL